MTKELEKIVVKMGLLCIIGLLEIVIIIEVDFRVKGIMYQAVIMNADGVKADFAVQMLQIMVSFFSMIITTTMTIYGATYIYRHQKIDERHHLEDEMHLLMKELGEEYKRIKELTKRITYFNRKGKANGNNNRGYLGALVDLWRAFENFGREEWFENYKKYYNILAMQQEITLRTGDKVMLSDFETDIQEIQAEIKQQYYEMCSLKEKMNSISYFFRENNPILTGTDTMGGESAIKRIERTLRNEGMNTDFVLDEDLDAVEFKFQENSQVVKQLTLFEKNTEKLTNKIQNSTVVTQKIVDKYFVD